MPDSEIEAPALLEDKLRAATDEGHFATLMAALGRRIGQIQAELPADKIDDSFDILQAAIEAGRIEELNKRNPH